MKSRNILTAILVVVLGSSVGYTFFKVASVGDGMTAAAQQLLDTLGDKEKAVAVLPYDSPKRVDWHFIPKKTRKGLMVRDMTEEQRKAASQLLQSALSEVGYQKATKIMELEELLFVLEGKKRRDWRDPVKYYYTIFGEPNDKGRWGLSIEGHHLSLNFVVDDGKVVSHTPQFFAANPAEVKDANHSAYPKGLRVLKGEEQFAFDLVNSLDKEQTQLAVIAAKAPAEVRGPGEAQPVITKAEGIPASKLTTKQVDLLEKLIQSYLESMPDEIAKMEDHAIKRSGPDKLYFAWAGATKPGVGHYYRLQGPSFIVEFVNTQPDAAGNPANHIHAVWRNTKGDFALPLK